MQEAESATLEATLKSKLASVCLKYIFLLADLIRIFFLWIRFLFVLNLIALYVGHSDNTNTPSEDYLQGL